MLSFILSSSRRTAHVLGAAHHAAAGVVDHHVGVVRHPDLVADMAIKLPEEAAMPSTSDDDPGGVLARAL
jgi:hypothetical protein